MLRESRLYELCARRERTYPAKLSTAFQLCFARSIGSRIRTGDDRRARTAGACNAPQNEQARIAAGLV
ncbi:hypothetical protein MYA_2644 [Burkholderia sp. KJ006]|nr:hypothetical protein MYA_2644 [Burkholderia sp. KJ006]